MKNTIEKALKQGIDEINRLREINTDLLEALKYVVKTIDEQEEGVFVAWQGIAHRLEQVIKKATNKHK